MTTKVFGDIYTGKEAKRLHLIAPILISVCALLKGDVSMVVDKDWKGTLVKANARFEFMIQYGDKAVCIVEAKKDDMEQGLLAQALVGCEVAAEVGGLDCVYGIVTNDTQWIFLRNLNNDKVEREECSLDVRSNDGPVPESLKNIAEKIYGMLSSGKEHPSGPGQANEVPGEGPGEGTRGGPLEGVGPGDGPILGPGDGSGSDQADAGRSS
jgi:hypothetical protein